VSERPARARGAFVWRYRRNIPPNGHALVRVGLGENGAKFVDAQISKSFAVNTPVAKSSLSP
jgi:hypothetical protein